MNFGMSLPACGIMQLSAKTAGIFRIERAELRPAVNKFYRSCTKSLRLAIQCARLVKNSVAKKVAVLSLFWHLRKTIKVR